MCTSTPAAYNITNTLEAKTSTDSQVKYPSIPFIECKMSSHRIEFTKVSQSRARFIVWNVQKVIF